MAYWIFENGTTIGPFEAAAILARAKPDTLVSNGQKWAKLSEHPDFRSPVAENARPHTPGPGALRGPDIKETRYWIHDKGVSLGPMSRKEVLAIARTDSLVSHGREWLRLKNHPDFVGLCSALSDLMGAPADTVVNRVFVTPAIKEERLPTPREPIRQTPPTPRQSAPDPQTPHSQRRLQPARDGRHALQPQSPSAVRGPSDHLSSRSATSAAHSTSARHSSGRGRKVAFSGAAVVALIACVTIASTFFHGGSDASTLPQAAGAFLMDSEARVWTMQGLALSEARHILWGGRETLSAVSNTGQQTAAEESLRRRLREERSEKLRQMADEFVATLDSDTSALLNDASQRLGLSQSDFVLDWITSEAAVDYGVLISLWRQRGNLKGRENSDLAESLFRDLVSPPDLQRGVTVLSLTESKVMVDLYGATVIEELVPEVGGVTDAGVTVGWRSNYSILRSIVSGEQAVEVMEDTLQQRGRKFGVGYKEYFEEFLTRGLKRPWATLLANEDPLALSRFVNEESVLSSTGAVRRQSPSQSGRSGEDLQALFRRLSPSVPMVDSMNGATGSGFVVQGGSELFLVTNRHVVKDAPSGFRLHFFSADGEARETFSVDLPATAVQSVSQDADLALISLANVAGELRGRVTPLSVATRDPAVGENVFVIGHPGAGEQVLSTTLTNGIVSAVREMEDQGRCVQITVPINPGNSGGPLFNERGEVVGVVTFTVRRGQGGLALEALNFAASVTSLNSLLSGSAPVLPRSQVASLVGWGNRQAAQSGNDDETVRRAAAAVSRMQAEGFRPYTGSFETSSRTFNLAAGDTTAYTFTATRGTGYGVVALSTDANYGDVDAAVFDPSGNVITSDFEATDMALVAFRSWTTGQHSVVIKNAANRPATVFMVLLEQ